MVRLKRSDGHKVRRRGRRQRRHSRRSKARRRRKHKSGTSHFRLLPRRSHAIVAPPRALPAAALLLLAAASTSAASATTRLLSRWVIRVGAGIGMHISPGRRRGRAGDLADVVVRPASDLGGAVPRRGLDGRVVLDGLAVVERDGAEFLAVARVRQPVGRGRRGLELPVLGSGRRVGCRRAARA